MLVLFPLVIHTIMRYYLYCENRSQKRRVGQRNNRLNDTKRIFLIVLVSNSEDKLFNEIIYLLLDE